MDVEPYLDATGYPTEAALRRLTEWGDEACSNPQPEVDVNRAIDFMRSLWHLPEWGVSETFSETERTVYQLDETRRYVKLSTGGWSGNEDLLHAFQSRWWRARSIVIQQRGGLYVIEYQ
jgi:hypothetical protein